MEINKNQLAEMLNGNIVVTVSKNEEIALINLIVANGYGSDVVKKNLALGVYMWHIKSKRGLLLNTVDFLRKKGVNVREASVTSPFTNYFENTQFFVKKEDMQGIECGCFLKENRLHNNGNCTIIYDLIPQ